MRIVKLKGMRQINGLHYAPDGRRLLAVGGHEVRSVDEARWVDVGAGTETLRVPLNASCYAVSADLRVMAAGEARPAEWAFPRVTVFDPTDAGWFEDESRCRVVTVGEHAAVHGLALNPDGSRVAVSFAPYSGDGPSADRFSIVPLDGRGRRVEMPRSGGSRSPLLAYSPDGRRLAASDGSIVRGIDGRTAKRSRVYDSTGSQVRQLVFSPDGDTLAIANGESVLLLPADRSDPGLTLAHPKQVNAVAFTPDGRRVLTTCSDKLVRVWSTATGQLVTSYDWNVGVTNAVAVAPDGLTAAVSGQNGRVVLFDLEG